MVRILSCVLALLLLLPVTALALTQKEVQSIAYSTYAEFDSKDQNRDEWGGSSVFIGKDSDGDGIWLTAGHMTSSMTNLMVFFQKKHHKAKLIRGGWEYSEYKKMPPEDYWDYHENMNGFDWAIVETPGWCPGILAPTPNYLPLAEEKHCFYDQNHPGKYLWGKVVDTDDRVIYSTSKADHGNSGAGVIDEDGNLIGILCYKWTDKKFSSKMVRIQPQMYTEIRGANFMWSLAQSIHTTAGTLLKTVYTN